MRISQRLALSYIRTKFKLLSAISKKKAAEKAFQLFCTPQVRNKKKLPKIFEEAEKLSLDVEGNTVRGWRFNKGGGRKAMIIHGFESSVINFDRYLRQLIKKGYEVLAFDAPAHGRSGGKIINAPLYKKTIQEVYKKFGPVQSFIAHSFGGMAVCLALEEISQVKAIHPHLGRCLGPPCVLRNKIVSPRCTEGTHFCGVPVWNSFPNAERRL